jgi:antitoxin ParD1/3/4
MPTMNVSLTDDLSAFVAEQLKDGGYNNQSEVVREGLRLLRVRSEKLARLQAAIAIGDADIAAGRTKPLTDALLHDIAERGRELSEARKQNRV